LVAIAAIAFSAIAARSIASAALPDATVTGLLRIDQTQQAISGLGVESLHQVVGASDFFVSASAGPDFVTASMSDIGGGLTSLAGVNLTYYAELVGPDFGTTVPVDLTYSGGMSVVGFAASANVEIALGGVSRGGSLFDPGDVPFSGALTGFFRPGDVFPIFMSAGAGGNFGSASASVDPMLTVDASFFDIDPNFALDYHFLLSPGFTNGLGPGIPEPSAWAMMLAGFLALGATLRTRRAGLVRA
jgi:hypothetical protein